MIRRPEIHCILKGCFDIRRLDAEKDTLLTIIEVRRFCYKDASPGHCVAARIAGGEAARKKADLVHQNLQPTTRRRLGIPIALDQAHSQMIDVVLPELCKVLPGHVLDLIDGQRDLLVLLDCQGQDIRQLP